MQPITNPHLITGGRLYNGKLSEIPLPVDKGLLIKDESFETGGYSPANDGPVFTGLAARP